MPQFRSWQLRPTNPAIIHRERISRFRRIFGPSRRELRLFPTTTGFHIRRMLEQGTMPAQINAAQITVLLVDNHAVVRDGLRMILESADDIKIIGEAENGHE